MGGEVTQRARGDDEIPQFLELRRKLEQCWSRTTTHPMFKWKWRKSKPSLGHCYVTALIVQDLFGGELMVGIGGQIENGKTAGDVLYHVWNRLPNNKQVDLTADQFKDGKVPYPVPGFIGKTTTVGAKRSNPRYKLLKKRMLRLQ